MQPNFPDHWKTKLLAELTGYELAPVCVIRFWGHCQQQRKSVFPGATPVLLKSICAFPGDAKVFWEAMLQTFCRLDGGALVAHQWEEVNSSLVAAWENGKKGGRPLKRRPKNPRDTHGIPTGKPSDNPRGTHGVPDRVEGEDGVDGIGSDVTREDSSTLPAATPAAPGTGASGAEKTAVDKLIEEFETDPTYAGLDVRREFGKMRAWCSKNGKKPSQRRFVNWLNRADVPLISNNGTKKHEPGTDISKDW